MAKYNDADIAATVISAGFKGDAAARAVAVVLAESGGDSAARGDVNLQTSTWGPSIGWFQIRSLNAQKGTGGERDEIANLDPVTNSRHALAISSNGTKWSPWSTYTNGKWLGYYARAKTAVANPGTVATGGGGSANPASTGNGRAASGAIPGLDVLTSPGTYVRLGAFVLGGVFVTIALFRATNAQQVIKGAVKTAVKVAA